MLYKIWQKYVVICNIVYLCIYILVIEIIIKFHRAAYLKLDQGLKVALPRSITEKYFRLSYSSQELIKANF
jgi:hypothetical protein